MDQSSKRYRVRCLCVLLLVLFSLVGGCTSRSQLCCLQYAPNTDEATYCNNHQTAVGQFVRSATPDQTLMRKHLTDFKAFYRTVQKCESVACIEEQLHAATTLPGFRQRYQTEHTFAEQETHVDPEKKASLVLCGFRHATDALDQLLTNERN